MPKNKKSRGLIFVIQLPIVMLLFYGLWSTTGAEERQPPSPAQADLSSPEKSIASFYEAFRTGNETLLAQVLIEGGSYAQFSATYQIDAPNPVIKGAKIVRKTNIKKWGGYGEPVETGDVLVYALTQKDRNHIARKPGFALPDEKFCFLVRAVNGRWKLVKVYNGWPSFPGQ